MILSGAISVADEKIVSIKISGSKIDDVCVYDVSKTPAEDEIVFDNAIVFPGLINSHDHLDFNCFPQLGNHQYNNYIEWGKDIHDKNADIISKVLQIPQQLRTQWGIYKNLLAGVTTVVNHGAFLAVNDDLIHVFQNCHSLHSVHNEKYWWLKLNDPFAKKIPYTIHVGEGVDEKAPEEINKLISWNILHKKLIGIHGVGMTEEQATKFKALVWCPASNYFLLGKTAPVDVLKKNTEMLFGTDSTLSASWDVWDHVHIAKATGMASQRDIFNMLTTTPAKIWQLPAKGSLKSTFDADLVIANKKEATALDAFTAVMPQDVLLVMRRGEVLLADSTVFEKLNLGLNTATYTPINIDGANKYVKGDLSSLIRNIKSYYPEANFPVS